MKLKRRINPDVERKLKDAIFVGKLADTDDLAGTFIKDPVSLRDEFSSDVQFHIKCLSPIPKEVSEQFYFTNEMITGNTISYHNAGKLNEWINFDRLPHFEVVNSVRSFLQNKLIVFTFHVNAKTEIIYAELQRVEDVSPAENGYFMIPGPQLMIDEEKEVFERKLAGERKPFTLKHYPHIFDLPEFMYCQGTIYQVTLKQSLNATTYSQLDTKEVFYRSFIQEEFMHLVDVRFEDHLYFVENDKLPAVKELAGYGILSENHKNSAAENRQDIKTQLPTTVDDVVPDHIGSKYHRDEHLFITALGENAKVRGLFFDEKDLYAFHISVKTNLLTIVGGMSGTGKSQLAKLYGETLGLESGKDLLMIPVSPSYHEPNDVLGYYNPTTGVFHETESGLVSLLLDAEKNPERMFMVIFDEMNLSQVEHWFSPFISLLEVDEADRYLTLFNEHVRCTNEYKPKVKIGNNIIFVGTVNFDETTRDFSDRLLDRTNVIVPRKLTFEQMIGRLLAHNNPATITAPSSMQTSVYRNAWVSDRHKLQSLRVLTKHEIALLDRVHCLLHDMDRQKGVSFRVVLGISGFLDNIPQKATGELVLDRQEAFDMQLTQRILTKINGLASFVQPLVGNMEGDNYIPGMITDILLSETGQMVSAFPISLDHLKAKAKELMMYGYAK